MIGWARRRIRGVAPALLFAGVALASVGPGAAPVAAQAQAVQRGAGGVWLVVRPRVGDTLHLQVEQTIERHGRRPASSSTSPEYGPRRDGGTRQVTMLVMYAHSLVESSDLAVTTLLATTDSVAMWAGRDASLGRPAPVPLPVDGRTVRVMVTADGAMRVADSPPGAMMLRATLASMPALLPEGPVRVGDSWDRDVALPALPLNGVRADGMLRCRFRLDSLTQGERRAWISMTGAMRREGGARDRPAATRTITAGRVQGTMVLDRQRAWIVDARTDIDVRSEVSAGPVETGQPRRLDLRITQRLRVR